MFTLGDTLRKENTILCHAKHFSVVNIKNFVAATSCESKKRVSVDQSILVCLVQRMCLIGARSQWWGQNHKGKDRYGKIPPFF